MTERCSKCGSPLDNEDSCFTHGKEQTEPDGVKVKTGEDADGYSAYALVWPGSDEVEHLPEENQTPLYAPETIEEVIEDVFVHVNGPISGEFLEHKIEELKDEFLDKAGTNEDGGSTE